MAFSPALCTCLALATFTVYWAVRKVLSHQHHVKLAREMGCKPPPIKPNRLPLGIDNAMDLSKADKEYKVPQAFMRVLENMGCETFVQSFFGTDIMVTHDPKNIQAVLAKQFQDFVLGEERHDNFFPLLGTGIFTSDGKAWCVCPLTALGGDANGCKGSTHGRCCDHSLRGSRSPTST